MRSLNLCVGGVDLVAMIGERDGEDMVAVKPISDALGMDWSRQRKKLDQNKERLNCGLMYYGSKDGKDREMLCIPLKKVAAWLFSINPNKVKEEYKSAVVAFQDELQHVLYSYARGDLTFEKLDSLLKLVEELRADNAALRADNEDIKRRIDELEYGTDSIVTHYASAGSHGMLAAKARKKHLRSVPLQ